MAITKETKIDKHEIVGDFKYIQCREATIIKEDGVEISRSFRRYVLDPSSDVSGESQETQDLSAGVWTDEVKDAFTAYMEAEEASRPPDPE